MIIEVVAGIVLNQQKILIARRSPGKHLAGYWEFPGGKLEPGENPEEGLARELKEELNLEVVVGQHFMDSLYHYQEKSILLKAYFAHSKQLELSSTDHDQLKWVQAKELEKYIFAPADVPIVEALLVRQRQDKG